LFCPNFAWQQ